MTVVARSLGAAFRRSLDEAPLRALASFADRQGAALVQLLPSLAGATRERAETSLALVRDIGGDTSRELAAVPCGCEPTPAPGTAVTPPTTAPQSEPPRGPAPTGSPAVVPDPTSAPRPPPTVPPPSLHSPVPSLPGVPSCRNPRCRSTR